MAQAIITRAQYMANGTFKDGETREQHNERCAAAHRAYYAQFVNAATVSSVLLRIGKTKLLASTDAHLNDIKLSYWDSLAGLPIAMPFNATGDCTTLSGWVCVAKEAARQWIESQTKEG